MNLIVADFLNISINLLLVLFVVIALLLLCVVLMQRPKQEGLGAAFGAAVTDQAFGARTTDVLKKATVWFGTGFMVLAFAIGTMMNVQHQKANADALNLPKVEAPMTPEQIQEQEARKLADQAAAAAALQAPTTPEAPAAPAPSEAPEAPASPAN